MARTFFGMLKEGGAAVAQHRLKYSIERIDGQFITASMYCGGGLYP